MSWCRVLCRLSLEGSRELRLCLRTFEGWAYPAGGALELEPSLDLDSKESGVSWHRDRLQLGRSPLGSVRRRFLLVGCVASTCGEAAGGWVCIADLPRSGDCI